ncbi:phytochrome-like protein [Moniliophthora roreri MCA 2997]|uniref:Phytochrome-like protein n=1 Tax=Moniliophthora roreri (strain MCA 2997) TaxID=1381753 RepID=V2WWL7_MONRO|nr:phytochrome-like protein [Moniliophthora roreri MCA 2997]
MYERPWNVSELGIVHLPAIPSLRASSRSADSREDVNGQQTRSNSSGHRSTASSNLSQYYTPEDFSSSGGSRKANLGGSTIERSSSPSFTSSADAPLATVRFQYVQDENGHHVVTGREGQFAKCEDEPIRTPGAVQGFGVLIAVEELEDRLLVRQASENATEILGLSPQYLFSLECFTDTLPESQANLLWDSIQFLDDPSASPGFSNPMNVAAGHSVEDESEQGAPHVFLISGYGAPGTGRPHETTAGPHDPWGAQSGQRRWTCWCAVHRPQPSPYLSASGQKPLNKRAMIIMEFELELDTMNPLYPPQEPASPIASKASTASGLVSPSSRSSGSSSGSTSVSSSSGSGSGGRGSRTGGNSTDESERTLVSVDSNASTATLSSIDSDSPISMEQQNAPFSLVLSSSQDTITTHDPLGPLQAQSGQKTTPSSLSGLRGDDEWVPSTEDILESTTSRSKPLLALERLRRLSRMPGPIPDSSTAPGQGSLAARRRVNRPSQTSGGANVPGAVGMMDVFAVIAQINDQLGAAPDLDTFLKIVVGLIKDLTQFHRVLVYQFDEMWNGQVVSELVDWSQTHDLYMGLHFPASDIPAQARELYKLNKVRILYDRDQATARLVARSKEDLDPPLNMTHCYLRAMSPIHIKYLGNMGVRASMSVSIMAFGTLWGLVACHSYGDHGMRVSFPVRQMLRLLSQSISRNIERLSYAQRLHTRKLINTISSDNHPTGYIVSNADDLLGLFDADFGILVIGDGAKILGPNEHGQEILIMAEYLRLKVFNSIQVSQAVTTDFPDLRISTGLEVVAGLLYVPLSSGGKDFIAFLRRGQPRHVHWAGKPFKVGTEASAVLEPRKSFKTWSEKVAGRCRTWTDEQLETAGVLALVYGKFIEVWRQKESALATTKLTNLLLSNASHEVRTPLNHIINYLEMALNGPLDGETRDNLSHSYTASKSLLFTINDLLDLTRLESGNETTFNEPFDLCNAIDDATYLYRKEASRCKIAFKLETDDAPRIVVGDARKIKTVVQNLTANALKYTKRGSITVRCTTYEEPEGLRSPSSIAVEIVVADTGCGIPSAKLESIFREFEQVESSEPKTSTEPGVGLGLAVVARIVEQLGGQLRVESKVGEGSRFSFLIPLSLDVDGAERSGSSASGSSLSSSLRSARSFSCKSGEREIDSLVEALSSNYMKSNPASIAGSSSSSSPGAIEAPPQIPPSTSQGTQGTFSVTDSGVPVRPVRISDMDPPLVRTHSSWGRLGESARPQLDRRHSPDSLSSMPAPPKKIERTKLRVLIVEDNDINRKILAKRLRMDGHDVVNTTNGQEGLDQVKADREFDCILMDINMPILDGYEASERIRQVERMDELGDSTSPATESRRLSYQLNGRIPIFAVSASLFEQQRAKLSDAGMDGWILKPIDFKRLGTLLSGVTDLEQREQDRYHPGCNWEIGGWLAETRTLSREASSYSLEDVPDASL